MENKYFKIIELLMQNDNKCGLDTLINECENNIEAAYGLLKDILQRLIEDTEEQEKMFYIGVLAQL